MGGNNVILTMRKLLDQLEGLLYTVSNQKVTNSPGSTLYAHPFQIIMLPLLELELKQPLSI